MSDVRRLDGRQARRRNQARRNAIRNRFDTQLQTQQKREKTKKATRDPRFEAALDWFQNRCYELFGERLDHKPRKRLESRLLQADYHVSPGLFIAMQWVATAAALVAGVLIITPVAISANGLAGVRVAAMVSLLLAVLTFLGFPYTVGQRIKTRSAKIEKELPFSLSELSVLATIGLSPIQLMQRMSEREHDPNMTAMFRKVTTKTTIQGMDIVGALAATAQESPSPILRETLWDLGNMMHQGGDLGPYLKNKSDHMLELKRRRQEAFTEQLGGFSEMFVTIVLIGTIFLGIGAFLMDAFGSVAGGLGAKQILQVLAYGFIPLVTLVIGFLVSDAYTKVQ